MRFNLQFIREVGPMRWGWRYGRRQFVKRILRRDQVFRLPTGLTMILPRDSTFASEVFVTGANVDWGSEALLARFAQPDVDFLDIGANIGYYSMYLAPLVRHVYAFEPDPRNFVILTRNAARTTNVTPIAKAIWSDSGSVLLDITGDDSTSHITREARVGIKVECVSVDKFLAERREVRAGLVKIDIEGYEVEALLGAKEALTSFQPLILAESSARAANAICRVIRQLGYAPFAFCRPLDRPSPCSLMQITPRVLGLVRIKMMFLVPERLRPLFSALV
jgi:FkbM family methyltransferase